MLLSYDSRLSSLGSALQYSTKLMRLDTGAAAPLTLTATPVRAASSGGAHGGGVALAAVTASKGKGALRTSIECASGLAASSPLRKLCDWQFSAASHSRKSSDTSLLSPRMLLAVTMAEGATALQLYVSAHGGPHGQLTAFSASSSASTKSPLALTSYSKSKGCVDDDAAALKEYKDRCAFREDRLTGVDSCPVPRVTRPQDSAPRTDLITNTCSYI